MQKERSLWNHLPGHGAWKYGFLLVITSFLLLLPYIAVQIPPGHDMLFHLGRIDGLATAYRNGDVFPAIFYNAFDGIGYGTPLFYGNLAIVFPAALNALGMPLIAVWKINVVLIVLLASLSCFVCAREMLKNDYSAFLMSVVFVFSGYFAADLFIRATIGELAAFIFVPVVFLGLFGILHDRKTLWPLLPIGLSLMLYCHLLSALITAFGLLLFALFHAHAIVRQPKKLLLLLASVGLFLLFSAFYILPVAEQLASNSFLATDGSSAVVNGTLFERAMPWWSLGSDLNFIVRNQPAPFVNGWLPNGLGLSLPLMLVAAILFRKRAHARRALTALILCVLTLMLCSNLFPWRLPLIQRTFGILQFPWRFLLLAVFFLALFAGEFAASEKSRAGRLVCRLFVIFSLFGFMMSAALEFAFGLHCSLSGDTIQYVYQYNIGAGEYLPSGLTNHTFSDLQTGAFSESPDMRVVDLGETQGTRRVCFSGCGSNSDATVAINLFFREPLSAAALLPDGTVRALSFEQTEPGARVALSGLQCGTILLECKPTVHADVPALAESATVTLGYGSVTVDFSGATSGNWIEVPLLWYRGYQSQCTAEDGSVSTPEPSAGTYGLCRVRLDAAAGTIVVRYRRTPLQIVSLAVSAISFFGAAIWAGYTVIQARKHSGQNVSSKHSRHSPQCRVPADQ